MNNLDFYRFVVAEAASGEEPTSAELMIFDAIGDWEELGEISAKAFSRDLAKVPASVKRLDIHINSPGGSLFDASAIYSRLADHKSEKHVYIDGLAASAATIVAMVGHRIYMRLNATMMIHLPSGLAMGNADDMRKMAGALDTITESMINVYAKRTGHERDVIRAMLAAETWLSPQEAMEKRFVDEVRGVVKAAASLGDGRVAFNDRVFDLSRFHNVPAFSAQAVTTTTKESNMNPTNAETQPQPGAADPPKPGAGDPTKPQAQATAPAPAPDPKPPPPTEDVVARTLRTERERVNALQALDRPATHAIIQAAIKDGKQVSDVVAECMDAMDKAQKQSNRRIDAQVLEGIPGSDGGQATADDREAFAKRLVASVKRQMVGRRSPLLISGNN